MTSVVSVKDDSFEREVLEAKMPVLVDFTATWCGPCRMLEPLLERLAGESAGRFKVVRIDIEEAPRVARTYGIRSVPTVMVFVRGERKAQHVGVTSLATLRKLLQLEPEVAWV